MDSFGTFLYQSGISIAVFYLFYWALLRKETWFSLNRTLLFSSLLLALTIPFVRITLHDPPAPGTVYYTLDHYLMDGVIVRPGTLAESAGIDLSVGKVLGWIYGAGVLFFFTRFLIQIAQVLLLVRKHGIRHYEGYRIVPIDKEIAPFSFFSLIFINTEGLQEEELRSILLHEWEHVRRLHTLDIIVLEIICILQWFNPFVWLYKYSLHELHEYEADQAVLRHGENRLNYQRLILSQAFGHNFFPVVHNLINRSFIKKRIIMITKQRSRNVTLLKSLLILPVAALLVVSFSFTRAPENLQQVKQLISPDNDHGTVSQTIPATATPQEQKKVYTLKEVDRPPKFQGKPVSNVVLWVKDQIRDTVPFTDKTLRISFTVSPKGKITDVDIVPDHTQIDPKYIQELRKIFHSAPKCSPGEKDGKTVAVRISSLPVIFFNSPTASAPEGEIFFIVEEMPKFQGGDIQKFREWVAQQIHYPAGAAEKGVHGKVFVRFVVEADGSVDKVSIVRGSDPLLDAEAVRVIKSSPRWTPGKQRGKNVAVAYTVPIVFLSGEERSAPEKATPAPSAGGEIFFIVEQMPKFQGGDINKFKEWVAQQLRYPDIAAETGASGRILVSFIVETDGSVSHVNVTESPYSFLRDNPEKSAGINLRAFAALDSEAVRVVKSSPKWEPGVQRGHRVRVKMTIPIVFILDHQVPAREKLKEVEGKNMVYVLDGRKVAKEALNQIDTANIALVWISHNKADIRKYGTGKEDGVVFITTKEKAPGAGK